LAYIDLIKEDLSYRLRSFIFKQYQNKFGNAFDISIFPDEVCDIVKEPAVFKHANIYGALKTFYLSRMDSNSETARIKCEQYSIAFDKALQNAYDCVSVPLIYSDTLATSELTGAWQSFPSAK
jgi:hypothetical protein